MLTGGPPSPSSDATPHLNSASMSRPVLEPTGSDQQDGGWPYMPANRFVRDPPSLEPPSLEPPSLEPPSLEPPSLPPGLRGSQSASPFRLPMPHITPGQVAFSALQFLPVPLLVLDGLKTVVMTNEAMGRLLNDSFCENDGMAPTMDQLRGQTLSQIGIDLTQGGAPVWVDWGQLLDQVAAEMGVGRAKEEPGEPSVVEGDRTSTSTSTDTDTPRSNAVIEVVISQRDLGRTGFDSRLRSKAAALQVHAKMIISVWEISQNQTFFTLTFTNTEGAPATPGKKSVADLDALQAAEKQGAAAFSKTPSLACSYGSYCSSFISPSTVSLSSSPFPPLGPPAKSSISSAPSILQKIMFLKDALLDNSSTPILAMWRDGSASFPNRAARDLFSPTADLESTADGFDLLPAWAVWTEDFSRQLLPSEYPISVIIRTETPFTGHRIGMRDRNGKRLVFDVEGVALRDDDTGEFLAGVVTCRDVTEMTEEISRIKAADEERFKLICDTMPQLVWTATPDGLHDFFNGRWYSYTGLTQETSFGAGWKNPFHPDDLQETEKRWKHSLATGEPYVTEYRCLSKEGGWRWFLGRALPLRNKETGKIEKWFGTCTDVHESIETKLEAKKARQQLLSVIALSHMTVFTVDTNRQVTMLEGALIWDSVASDSDSNSRWYVGKNVYDVFNRLSSQLRKKDGQTPPFLQPLELILTGKATSEYQEHEIDGCWYRTRFQPIISKRKGAGGNEERVIEGVTGIVMDVTELKAREKHIQTQAQEKRRLVANEAAAKEASRLKSQFLANMSHEIRTPISGVIGMAELLMEGDEEEDHREITENIYRSANALLSVINDILDFSKIESGRLDIEEVEFSLSMVVQDVTKMLRYAAERKDLDFKTDIAPEVERDLMLLGDPGRVRQILTNLLTNSIKFTNQGYVRFSVKKEKETPDSAEIKFVVEDTGIGIEDEVRKRLFQPFSQGDPSTARKFGGTGLGLTISKNLLDLMKGRMSMESIVGKGTTTTFWIPFNIPHLSQVSGLAQPLPDRLQSEMSLSRNSSEYEPNFPPADMDKGRSAWRHSSISLSALGSPEEDLPTTERAGILVLVVEDNAINQHIATKTIKKLGFQVTAVWNGKEALDYLTAAQNGITRKPDVILMDVQMPLIDGYKCTHILRHHNPYKIYVSEIPIVAMTASAIQGDKEKCKRAGMDDYLSKPVKSKMLERMLIRWSTKRRLKSSPVEGLVDGLQPVLGDSDCSETGERCDKADIPGIVDNPRSPLLPDQYLDDFNDQVTPRPPAHEITEERLVHFPGFTTSPRTPKSDFLRCDLVQFTQCSTADGVASGDGITAKTSKEPADELTHSLLPLTRGNIGRLDHESQKS